MSINELKQKIHDEVEKSDNPERLELILEELTATSDDIPDWHKEILEERLKDYEENPENVISYEELKAELKKKYGI